MNSRAMYLLGWVFIILIFIAFDSDRLHGWRLVGMAQIVFGIYFIRKREVGVSAGSSYPSFFIRGVPAIFLGVVGVAFGTFLVVMPQVMEGLYKP